MRLFWLSLVAFLIVLTRTGSANSDLFVAPTDSRVSVEFYYETMSPDSREFISQQLKPLTDIKGVFDIVDIKMIPSGNTNVDKFGREYEFTCRQGEAQCIGNSIHQCCLSKYGTQTCLPFITCLERTKRASRDWQQTSKGCARPTSVDWDVVKACTNSIEGRQRLFQSILYTRYTRPKNFPWLVVNNEQISLKNVNLIKVICQDYSGAQDSLPRECNQFRKKVDSEDNSDQKEQKTIHKKKSQQKRDADHKP